MRKIGIWMYQNGGGAEIEAKIKAQLEARGMEVVTGLNLRHAVVQKEGIICNGQNMVELDLFFSYNAGQQTIYQVYMYEVLSKYTHLINSYESFSMSEDKLRTNLKLAEKEINTPRFFMCHRDDTKLLSEKAKKWDYKFVYKPIDGWGGMGMALIQNEESFNMLLPFMNSSDVRQFYIEEFIENDRTDFRIDIVGGEFVACYGRQASSTDWRTNVTSGGKVIMREADDDVIDIAIRASDALGMDIAGVDILFDEKRKKYVVLEVNGIPAFATPEQEEMGLDFNDEKIAKIVDLIDRKSKEKFKG